MDACLHKLGLKKIHPGVFDGQWHAQGALLDKVSPINGTCLAQVRLASHDDYPRAVARAQQAFLQWRVTPAPVRGETIRQLGNAFREVKADLGRLITLETGKILAEGQGEVQEMIDICDLATGLSRQLPGLTLPSERPHHRLMEQWHPLGPIGVITAFNFPAAVWAWNAALAVVCGNPVLWKPSEKTPLTSIAITRIAERVCRATGAPPALFTLLNGTPADVGSAMAQDPRLPLLSATGSSAMGRRVAAAVHARLGRTLLELGGNNAVIVTPSADLDLAVDAIFFGAVGTAGQRCTSTRRVLVHESIEKKLRKRLLAAYQSVVVGNPLRPGTLMGPLINAQAVTRMEAAMRQLVMEGGTILHGGQRLRGAAYPGGCYVTPCLAQAAPAMPMLQQETFAPILYLLSYSKFNEAIALQNGVPQGLSSAIFTKDLQEAELFISAQGSDCGLANVNAGTSGAEIGGAFGGEKETGGGRESGSDAWKNYMRRQTNTINASSALPLAQGIQFSRERSKSRS